MTVTAANRLMWDVSDYQIAVDMTKVARTGCLAIMIKGAEGQSTIGAERYRERARAAHRANMRVVTYHLLRADDTPRKQVETLLRQIDGIFQPGDRLIADLEDAGGFTSPGQAATIVEEWASDLHKAGHTSPGGYSNRAWKYLAACQGLLAGWIIADYGTWRRPNPLDRRAVRTLWGRQFTNGVNGPGPHQNPGISGPADCSRLTNTGIKTILQRKA